MKIRTRYAPSPTGFFHVGGARTALFNYLFARHYQGDFIVRIEDTDVERNVEGGIKSQLDNLAWLGLSIDESVNNPGDFGPYIQTQKLARYQQLAQQLLDQKKAYYCFCTKEQLEAKRQDCLAKGITPKYGRDCLRLTQAEIDQKLASKIPYVIRLKITQPKYEWDDLIRGKISVPSDALTDPVILKSNGIPMYNFAVVVDDYDMQISHVIRGEEHISNTPYQIAIKQALGFDKHEIKYGHLSVIVNQDGKKLSKRDLSLKQFIQDYLEMGFYPQAIVNFLALLGWAPTDNKEIMSLEQMVQKFDINHISKAPTFFDYKKMLWFSNKYFINLSEEQYLEFVEQYLTIDLQDLKPHKKDLVLLFKKQISYAKEINQLIQETFFEYNLANISREIEQQIHHENWIKSMQAFDSIIQTYHQQPSIEQGKQIIDQVKQKTGNNGMDLFMPIRLLITGHQHGPELFKIIHFLPLNQIKLRMKEFFTKYGIK